MKNNHWAIFMILIVLMSIQSVSAQTKYALLFAISNYPAAGGWSALSSNRDVFYITTALQKQGFLANNIQTITESEVTPPGITRALMALIQKAKAGDIAVIHFSTHGEQVEDDNGDETDGLDETIVTYHAIKPELSRDFTKEQAAYFRDDQFGVLIDKLRDKVGSNGDIVVFMDLCHSGSGTRGLAKVRGNEPPFVSVGFDAHRFAAKDASGVFMENISTGTKQEGWGTYVVFSAARASEASFEVTDDANQGMGALTYAICKAFENLDAGITYRSLFSKVQAIVQAKRPGQYPVLEGNGIDRKLFGGKFVQQKPFVEIEKIKGTELTLKSGKLVGLDSGAKVTVYPSGTLDPTKATALASGYVTKAGFYRSIVQLDKKAGIEQEGSAWVFVTETVYIMDPIGVQFISFTDTKSLKENLKELPIITWEGEPELIIVKGSEEDSIKFATTGKLYKTVQHSDPGNTALIEALRRYAQYKFLQGLEFNDPNTNTEVRLVPVLQRKANTAAIDQKIKYGTYVFNEGDTIALWIKNKSSHPVYFNVLDLQPDGIINPVFPNKQLKIYPQDLRIEAGQSKLFQRPFIVIAPPYGMEIFKVFTSKTEIDMEGIVNVRRGEEPAKLSSLEQLVDQSFEIGTRKGRMEKVNTSEGSIYSVLFETRSRK
ncbi:caspase family protein [Chitinophagaceae bacterium LB-8]|uniref:Caspase family protein n=1 Tax=Paraflavisolibacter caeni TaxID=2982496 RepID=A0A9X2XYY2_9BACT|nr:caspase family protein [Paraflavisolibacter caeni]MCU7551966.1 caspase family protein [Paraflavisolibacter caeni]